MTIDYQPATSDYLLGIFSLPPTTRLLLAVILGFSLSISLTRLPLPNWLLAMLQRLSPLFMVYCFVSPGMELSAGAAAVFSFPAVAVNVGSVAAEVGFLSLTLEGPGRNPLAFLALGR